MASKFDREIQMLCPTCGGTQFEFGDDETVPDAVVRCVSCDRQLTRGELLAENQAHIDQHVAEIGEAAAAEAAEQLRKTLRDAFRGNTVIKFK